MTVTVQYSIQVEGQNLHAMDQDLISSGERLQQAVERLQTAASNMQIEAKGLQTAAQGLQAIEYRGTEGKLIPESKMGSGNQLIPWSMSGAD